MAKYHHTIYEVALMVSGMSKTDTVMGPDLCRMTNKCSVNMFFPPFCKNNMWSEKRNKKI